jgi:replicative DNA helicase
MTSNEETIVYSPPEIMHLSMQQLQRREDDPRVGVKMHVPALDDYMIPMRPGDLVAIIGRPSNYKTGLMLWTLRKEAENIMRDIRQGDKDAVNDIVVYVTWEIAIEEAGLMDLASATRIDVEAMARGNLNEDAWRKLREKAARRSGFPLWILGHSIERRKTYTWTPSLTPAGGLRITWASVFV